MKKCSKCSVEKDLSCFYFRKDTGRYRTHCKSCIRVASDEYKNNNKDRAKQIKRRWYEKNAEKISEFNKTVEGRFHTYKRSAKRRGIDFGLTFDQFDDMIDSACHWCGDSSQGIDRIGNSLGYFPENCASCCEFCNKAKMDNDKSLFLERVEKIFRRHLK